MEWEALHKMMLLAAKKHRIRGEEPLEFLTPVWCAEGHGWLDKDNPRFARAKMNQTARGYRGLELKQRRRIHYQAQVDVAVEDKNLKHIDNVDEIQYLTAKLTDRERKVIYWLFYQDKTQTETGVLIDGLSRTTVMNIRDIALEKMRKELGICVEKETKPGQEQTGKNGVVRTTRYPVKRLSFGPEMYKEN